MRINKLTLFGFKGVSGTYTLPPVTVVVGASMSGKSALLQGVKVALLGYMPELGKRPGDIKPLMTGAETLVTGALDNGDFLSRTWKLKKDSVTYHGSDQEFIPSLMFDAAEYFKLSGPARIRFVFSKLDLNLNALGFTSERLLETLRTLKPEPPTPELDAAVKMVYSEAAELEQARIAEDVSLQEYVETLLTTFKDKRKAAKDGIDTMKELAVGATALSVSESAPVGNREQFLNDERALLERMTNERAGLQSKADGLVKWQEKFDKLRNRGFAVVEPARVLEFEQALAAAQRKFQSTPTVTNQQVSKAYRDWYAVSSDAEVLKNEAERLQDALVGLEAGHKADLEKPHCPYCKSSRKGWQSELVKVYEAEWQSIQDKINATNQKRIEEVARARKLGEVHSQIQVKADEHTVSSQAVIKAQTDLDNARTLNAEYDAHKRELSALLEHKPMQVDSTRWAELDDIIRAVRERIDKLEAEQRRYLQSQAEELQLTKARAKRRKLEAEQAVYAHAVDVLTSLQTQMVKAAIGGLLGKASLFTDGILKGKLQFEDGELGYNRDGTWISHEVFSGTEQALAYAGLSVALTDGAVMKIVVIDELGIMDFDVKRIVVARMYQLIEQGHIHQFIGADTDARDYVGTEAELIEV